MKRNKPSQPKHATVQNKKADTKNAPVTHSPGNHAPAQHSSRPGQAIVRPNQPHGGTILNNQQRNATHLHITGTNGQHPVHSDPSKQLHDKVPQALFKPKDQQGRIAGEPSYIPPVVGQSRKVNRRYDEFGTIQDRSDHFHGRDRHEEHDETESTSPSDSHPKILTQGVLDILEEEFPQDIISRSRQAHHSRTVILPMPAQSTQNPHPPPFNLPNNFQETRQNQNQGESSWAGVEKNVLEIDECYQERNGDDMNTESLRKSLNPGSKIGKPDDTFKDLQLHVDRDKNQTLKYYKDALETNAERHARQSSNLGETAVDESERPRETSSLHTSSLNPPKLVAPNKPRYDSDSAHEDISVCEGDKQYSSSNCNPNYIESNVVVTPTTTVNTTPTSRYPDLLSKLDDITYRNSCLFRDPPMPLTTSTCTCTKRGGRTTKLSYDFASRSIYETQKRTEHPVASAPAFDFLQHHHSCNCPTASNSLSCDAKEVFSITYRELEMPYNIWLETQKESELLIDTSCVKPKSQAMLKCILTESSHSSVNQPAIELRIDGEIVPPDRTSSAAIKEQLDRFRSGEDSLRKVVENLQQLKRPGCRKMQIDFSQSGTEGDAFLLPKCRDEMTATLCPMCN